MLLALALLKVSPNIDTCIIMIKTLFVFFPVLKILFSLFFHLVELQEI